MKNRQNSNAPQPNSSRLKREILRFLIVGGIAVAIDALLYYIILDFNLAIPAVSKRISFTTGAVWAYFANKYFTFLQSRIQFKEPFKFAIIYLIGFILNSLTHDLSFHFDNSLILSFLLATGVSTVWNFIGQKWFVFK